jgi:hypothetical protein
MCSIGREGTLHLSNIGRVDESSGKSLINSLTEQLEGQMNISGVHEGATWRCRWDGIKPDAIIGFGLGIVEKYVERGAKAPGAPGQR